MALPIIAAGALTSAIVVPLVIKVMVGLGVGFITYTGVTLILDQALSFVIGQFSDLPGTVAQLLAMANVDRYVTMIFSAYSARLVLSGLNASGALTRFTARGVA